MKKVFLLIATAIAFASCGNEAGSEGVHEDHTGHEHAEDTNPMARLFTEKDPVCDMTRKESWVEYSINGSDTTWFCSPVCKEQFEASPEKYKS
jgi:YHS domain-containing protein